MIHSKITCYRSWRAKRGSGRPTVSVCPGLRGFLSCGIFSAEMETVSDQRGELVTIEKDLKDCFAGKHCRGRLAEEEDS